MTILSDIYDRVNGMTGLKTVVKKKRVFHENELPAASVYPAETSVIEVGQFATGYRMDFRIGVEYHKKSGSDPASDWETMVNTLRAALEVPADSRLNETLCEPLELIGIEAPELPDDAGEIVAAQLVYSAKYVSDYGS